MQNDNTVNAGVLKELKEFGWVVCVVFNGLAALACWEGINVSANVCFLTLGAAQLILLAYCFWFFGQLSLKSFGVLVFVCSLAWAFSVPEIKRNENVRAASSAVSRAGGKLHIQTTKPFCFFIPKRLWPPVAMGVTLQDRTEAECQAIFTALKSIDTTQLDSVTIQGEYCSDATLTEISKLANLRSLHIYTRKGPTNVGVQRVANGCRQLMFLRLGVSNGNPSSGRWQYVTDDAMIGFRDVHQMQLYGLTSLNGEMFQSLPRLAQLSAFNCGFQDSTASSFARLSMLRSVDLEDCPIGNRVFVAISKLPSIERIWIRSRLITDAGAKTLLTLEHGRFEQLTLSANIAPELVTKLRKHFNGSQRGPNNRRYAAFESRLYVRDNR
ncbi:MAG: hypothetical protein KDB27_14420 [Planctomycetales bacterium]|nr:hypothetical protein [Planctomycetales bacterium]